MRMVVYMDALGNNPLGLKLENRVAIDSVYKHLSSGAVRDR